MLHVTSKYIALQREQDRLDTTQLLALKEFLPTQEERSGLEAYMRKAKTDEETAKAYADLSDCEKYMWTMRRVENAASKFDCMIFKSQFRTRVDELLASIRVIEQACDEVKSSEKLQKIFAMILTLVNTINTGGEEKGVAQGFNLEALLKLNEVSTNDVPIRFHDPKHSRSLSTFPRRKHLIKKLAFYNTW